MGGGVWPKYIQNASLSSVAEIKDLTIWVLQDLLQFYMGQFKDKYKIQMKLQVEIEVFEAKM